MMVLKYIFKIRSCRQMGPTLRYIYQTYGRSADDDCVAGFLMHARVAGADRLHLC